MKRIEAYTDYRRFLADYYRERKKDSAAFSYRYFCMKSGIKSPIFYKEVVEGRRNLTSSTIPAFIKGLGLTSSDGKFFTALVNYNQSKNAEEKKRHFEQMRNLRKKVKQQAVPTDLYEYYSCWYNPVIRELAVTVKWDGDFGKLARMLIPRIKASQAQSSVEFLLEKGFLKVDKKGSYRQAYPAITSGSEVTSLGVRNFNETMSRFAAKAIHIVPPVQRDIRTVTMGISQNGFKLIKEEIREFLDRVIHIVNDDNESDRVYNFGIQLFPLSTELYEGDENETDD